MSSKFRLVATSLVLILTTSPILAQEQLFRTVKAEPGKQARLGIIGNITKECTPGPTPDVKVVTPPKQGVLAIRSGKLRAGSLKRCPTLEPPIRGVFYQAYPTFSGTDEVVYEVKLANGKTQTITSRIEVGTGPAPAAKPDDGDNL